MHRGLPEDPRAASVPRPQETLAVGPAEEIQRLNPSPSSSSASSSSVYLLYLIIHPLVELFSSSTDVEALRGAGRALYKEGNY